MKERGTHTYPIFCEYHACPQCRAITESRIDYENRFGQWVKEVECERCGNRYFVEKTFVCRKAIRRERNEWKKEG